MGISSKISPFHLAIPVWNLKACRKFYKEVLGCTEGRSSSHWVDMNLFGHQLVLHFKPKSNEEIHANEVLSLKKRLNEIYSKHTGKSVDEVKTALERDNFMTADVAKDFGLIDEVVDKRS